MSLKYQPGEIIQDRYRITGVLGQGGVAITYSAVNLETESTVAIKVISLKQLDNWKQIELFKREAEVLAKLDHPAIPQYIDYFDIETETDKAFYIVQQQAPGKSLAQLVESGWRSNEGEVKNIAQQVLSILTYLHSLEPPVIHRDIKPSNIIYSDDKKIYLVDFGAVQNTYYNTLMQGSTVVGTYGYMAPEQFRGQALPATDLYSLGVTLLYLLTHRSPAELPQDTLKLDFRNSVDISESFADWLEKILEPDLDDRFANAEVALAKLFASKKKKQKKLITSIGIGVLALALIAGFNSYKWFFLSRLGYIPNNICSSTNTIQNYLKDGGKVNIFTTIEFNPESILDCIIKSRTIENKSKVDIIKLLIKKGADVNSTNKYSQTSLFIAIKYKLDLDIIRILINAGADINAQDSKGDTPLFYAAENKDKKMMQVLLDAGADINTQNLQGETLLFKMIWKTDIAQLLITNGADTNIRTKRGLTPLFRANNKNIAVSLINAGANVNALSNDNITPLFLAAKNLYPDIVQLLIDSGVNVNHSDNDGQTALFYAAISASYGSFKSFQILVDAGADVNAQDNKKETPLFNAVHYSHLNVVKFLVDQGADVNAVSNDGSTPIFHSIDEKNTQFLIDEGADVNARNTKGETPLFYTWHSDLVKLLIKNGADVNVKDKEGRTLLSDLIVDRTNSDRYIQNFTLLIENGADLNEINYEMITRLYDLKPYQHRRIQGFLRSQRFIKLKNHENN